MRYESETIKMQTAMIKAMRFYMDKCEETAWRHWHTDEPDISEDEKLEPWTPGGVVKTSVGDFALQDYYEVLDGKLKKEFVLEEARKIEEDTNSEWRVPTLFEWNKLIEEFGRKGDTLDGDYLASALSLTTNEYGEAKYWSTTDSSPNHFFGYALFVGSEYALLANQGPWTPMPVRLIRNSK